MKTFKIKDREAGNVIETGIESYEAAKELIESFEKFDRNESSYTPDFYEIKEEDKD